MLFICYKMNILGIMIVTGIFCQKIAGEHHIKSKIKRQIVPSLHNEGVADYNSLQYLNENQIFQERYPYHGGEMVGIFPFGLMRGAAKQFTRRIKTRARQHHHHPHLLEPTPDHLLHDDGKLEEKNTDPHEVNEFNPMLRSPQLYHEENKETSANVLPSPTPQTVMVNRMNDHYEPQTTGKVICNFYDPEEMIYKPPQSRSRHSSEQEEPPLVGNPFQGRHFYEKGYIYGLLSKHLRKHPKPSNPTDNTTPGNSQYNHPLTLNNDGSQVNGQNSNLPQSPTTQPISSINGEKITINQNFQISQIAGNNNGVSQAQQSNQHDSNTVQNDLTSRGHKNQNYQGSQIHGNYNAVSQSQASHQNNLKFMQDDFNDFFNNENDQMSQIYGSNNAVKQSQVSNHHQASVQPNNNFYPTEDQYPNMPDDNYFSQIHENENFQGSNIYGSNNAVTQEQSSNHRNIVGAPYVVHFDQMRPYYPPRSSHEQFIHPLRRKKRQLKIWNLITDPNSHLDVSQTIENVGHAARSAMEDKKHPNFHIKNAVGSAKNAILSTMKMIPQDFIIPSDYKIIGKSDEQNTHQQSNKNGLRAINPNLLEKSSNSRTRASPKFLHEKYDDVPNEEQFVQTYAKVGSMVRDSVRSSKETLNHIGDVYSNARKAVAAARHSVPKMLTKSMRIPEVRRNFQRKPMERVGSRNNLQDNFVGASEVMNSFGFLTSRPQKVNWKRNTVTQNPTKVSRQTPDKYVVETMRVLHDARNAVGANSINEFLVETEKKYNSVYENKMKERHSNRQLSAEAQQQSLDTRNTFDVLKSLTNDDDDVLGSSPEVKNEKLENLNNETEYYNEKSRISMTMGKKLVTPYMGKLKHVNTEPYYDIYEDNIKIYK